MTLDSVLTVPKKTYSHDKTNNFEQPHKGFARQSIVFHKFNPTFNRPFYVH